MEKKKRAAFTLVELIVVLAILAVLLVVIVPRLTGYIASARETAVKNNAASILKAAELYTIERERDGLSPQTASGSPLTRGSALDSYIEKLDEDDTYSISISKNSSSQYEITGSYTSGDFTVSIPDMTVSQKSP